VNRNRQVGANLSAERSATNEAAFRRANEQLTRRRLELLGADASETAFLCECEDASCTKVLLLSLAEYERARESPRRFLVAPAHAAPDEVVIVLQERFWLIEKQGVAARVAEEEDERRREERPDG
jgi:hypothetical protein